MNTGGSRPDQEQYADVSAADNRADEVPAWEQIENGRYQPRRIRGSYRGRTLG